MKSETKEIYKNYLNLINEGLEKSINIEYPEKIYEAMRYSLLLGGKRLRPVMALETAKMLGGNSEEVLPSALAIEMLHCQSLIHDDLPCMDNDDFRRGKPSNHKAFGEATAVLAGDAFLSYAPKFIIDKTPASVSKEAVLKVLREFFIAAGTDGIISGQIVDLDSEHKKIDEKTLNFLYEYKTAKLFKLAVRTGGIIAGADSEKLEALTKYAEYFGHAFQVYDDILDEISTFEEIGKTPKKDANVEKSNYVSLFGIDRAKQRLTSLVNSACDILKSNNLKSSLFEELARDLTERIN
ncbi:polyprenyl synthetase family protein [bacterium]|nr:polyprenyl synthetase family protein [bacterium]